MASTYSRGDQPRRSPWFAILIAVAVLAVIGFVAYLFLYGDTGGGEGSGGGGAGGGYFILAFGGDMIRRIARTLRSR
jgi:hypothetical protein